MEIAGWLVVMSATVLVVAVASKRVGVTPPLSLVVVGVLASFIPGVPQVELSPDLVLIGLLPPLLYAAAIQSSLVDFRTFKVPILMLSVGLVAFTAVGVGLAVWWVLGVPFAAALALGAVVGPPDAVAATAIGRRIGLPRHVVTLLEGESLINDATAIVLLRTSAAAIVGAVTFGDVVGGFALSAIGGVVVGAVVAYVVGFVQKQVTEVVATTALSLLIPYLAYLPAEEIHASGVLSVVVAGLLLAHRAPVQQSATARIGQRTNWATIQFLLENVVFLLIGLQVRSIVRNVVHSSVSWSTIVLVCLVTFLAVVLLRPLWIFLYRVVLRLSGDPSGLPFRDAVVLSYAGMRGVVTLAAAFALPMQTPHRNVLVFAAMIVTAGTLLLQGSTLPTLARRLGVRGPDLLEDALQEAQVMRAASMAGLRFLEAARRDEEHPVNDAVANELRRRSERRVDGVWEQLGNAGEDSSPTPSEVYAAARLRMLQAEREEVLRIRDEGRVDHEILQHVMSVLDIEESMLDRAEARVETLRGAELRTPAAVAGECDDLIEATQRARPQPNANTCEQCRVDGTDPVHLRICLTCGQVGCCDSSVGRHATRHHQETGHPVMQSFEPGEVWRWCFKHQLLG
ncbi:Na+/H+ antiporter [Leekyejoonella antrihumi]|uniref:Na+/H+ antiporter n=1 Tax=Leekyejoonella antrihumi TaxID=1660198 RepID=A0A563DQ77_9MICO|nr:Na+/H+ antiporter [Leekyejoonella antrihumi]TWP32329.1 Na+/H+ antiporter [Leekyejoonella antrihumi]